MIIIIIIRRFCLPKVSHNLDTFQSQFTINLEGFELKDFCLFKRFNFNPVVHSELHCSILLF